MTDLLSPSDTGEIQVAADETPNLTRYYSALQLRSPLPRPDVADTVTTMMLPQRASIVLDDFQPPTTPDVPRPSLPPTPPPPTPNGGWPPLAEPPMPVPVPTPPQKVRPSLLRRLLAYGYQPRHHRQPVWAWRLVRYAASWVLLSVAALLLIFTLSGCRVLEPPPETPGSTYRVPDAGMPRLNPAPAQDDTAWIGGER